MNPYNIRDPSIDAAFLWYRTVLVALSSSVVLAVMMSMLIATHDARKTTMFGSPMETGLKQELGLRRDMGIETDGKDTEGSGAQPRPVPAPDPAISNGAAGAAPAGFGYGHLTDIRPARADLRRHCSGEYACDENSSVVTLAERRMHHAVPISLLDQRCATEDRLVVALIERVGVTGEVPADRLNDAGLGLVSARLTCSEGRVAEALVQYETVMIDTLVLTELD